MKPNPFILCATDFSIHAREAATVAAKLAARRGERLRLVHAADVPRASMLLEVEGRLSAEAHGLRKFGVEVESIVLDDVRPAKRLLAYIKRERPTLVVVGCSNKGALDRWALGSFSELIAEGVTVPTLVVRNPAMFEAWDWARGRLSVLLALDFSPTSEVVLRWAKQFQGTGPCDFTACHVNWRMPGADAAGAGGPLTNPAAVQSRLERDLRKKVRDQMGDDAMPQVVRPCFGDPGPCIVEIAAERKAQLIAIGTHQRHGLHRLAQFSVSREVLHQADTNVICVPVTTKFDSREAHIPEFRRVLVATDFSELGNTAIPFACATCCIGGLVKILHVLNKRTLGKPRSGRSGSTEVLERLRALIPHEIGARAQPPEVEVIEDSDVPGAICSAADCFGADVVCLASHGLGASRALHGSVTKAVLKRLSRPLLVVRRPGA